MSVGHYGDRQCTTKKECSRDTITQKEPAYPLETKVGSTAGVKFYVIVSRLVVTHCLVKAFMNILRQMLDTIQGNWTVFNPKIKKFFSVTETRFAGLYSEG